MINQVIFLIVIINGLEVKCYVSKRVAGMKRLGERTAFVSTVAKS